MADRPIIFSAPMVRAIRDGRKTQTRRVLKPQPEPWRDYYLEGGCQRADWSFKMGTRTEDGKRYRFGLWMHCGFHESRFHPLPYAPGDRLWVRETWATWMLAPSLPGIGGNLCRDEVTYKATDPDWHLLERDRRALRDIASQREDGRCGNWVIRSPIHMPRWASRITLEVTDVRVQRLQEINEDDATAEGCSSHGLNLTVAAGGLLPCIEFFRDTWASMHGPGSWEANPWVAAVSFKRVSPAPSDSGSE